jgi:hypothetical protein
LSRIELSDIKTFRHRQYLGRGFLMSAVVMRSHFFVIFPMVAMLFTMILSMFTMMFVKHLGAGIVPFGLPTVTVAGSEKKNGGKEEKGA